MKSVHVHRPVSSSVHLRGWWLLSYDVGVKEEDGAELSQEGAGGNTDRGSRPLTPGKL